MLIQHSTRPRCGSQKSWGAQLSFVLMLTLFVALIPAIPHLDSALSAAPRAQPEIVALANREPNGVISVIVQKDGAGAGVEQYVAQSGGEITLDLHIINAFAAKLAARSALSLARMSGVHWVSLDAPIVRTTGCTPCVGSTNLKNAYISAIRADRVWNEAPYLQGQNIGVAVVDSGITHQVDFYSPAGANRVVAAAAFNDDANRTPYDGYGHGTHVAGIIGGDGEWSNGGYIGVAPMVNLINVKISNDNGGATASNLVRGLQWIKDNKDFYNIRVVNLSVNSSVAESYHTNPIDAAVEILWFNKITVVVSAGNNGKNALYPPANDPFVITVGAADDRGTRDTSDDMIAAYSAYGTTTDGLNKPDLVAPGTNIVSLMPNFNTSALAASHPANIVNSYYFRMSGTSMAAPMVSGAVALLLQDEPNLTPDQVKYRLTATARAFDTRTRAGAGYLDVYAMVHGSTTQSANTGIPASRLLWSGSAAVNWNSVNWNSVNWNSVNWNSVNWNSVNWNSDFWGN
jgi:serine protease AprX